MKVLALTFLKEKQAFWSFRNSIASLLSALLLMLALPSKATAQGAEGFSDLVERVGSAVVNIQTTKDQIVSEDEMRDLPQFPPGSPFEEFFRDFFERDRQNGPERSRPSSSLGSGFVIDPDGYVVTNNHVIAGADEILVAFNDDREFKAQVIGRDPKTDLALLKIEGNEPFPYVEWANSDLMRVGDWMVAIGNPFGFGFSVTAGIISGRGRDIRAGPYDDFFQVDAAINRGNSGGPSFNLDGRVFGVNTAIFSPSGGNVGIGFAIPSNQARKVIASLRENGRVARGWLGVRIQSVTEEIAESLGLETVSGALVASVTPGGPAAEASIEKGDVILEFNGQPITQMRSLPRIVADTPVSERVQVKIWRRGTITEISVVLGELPDDEELAALASAGTQSQAQFVEIPDLGLVIAQIGDQLREQFSLSDDQEGVVIVDVVPGTPAEEEALRPGDIIVEVNQEEISSPPELVAKVNNAQNDDKKNVLLLIDRAGDLRFVALSLA